MTVDQLPPDWRAAYEERAAIMEYDGGLSPEEANRLALVDTLERMARMRRELISAE